MLVSEEVRNTGLSYVHNELREAEWRKKVSTEEEGTPICGALTRFAKWKEEVNNGGKFSF